MYYAEFAGNSGTGFVLNETVFAGNELVSAYVVNGDWWLKKNQEGFWCAHNDLTSKPVSVTTHRDMIVQKIPDAMAKSHYNDIIQDMRGKMSQSTVYPKRVMPGEVVNHEFGPDLFRIKGGRALYDQVTMQDGGKAVYLVRLTDTDEGLLVQQRWIPWDTELEQMYEVKD